ncbi:hypothetical protein [Falsiroseomonas sp.]|uniref:hypothetical protein n=1 Tax=Falsiroseomonas sp. TaxID=2870721 RepID=UPI00273405D8|nr:hypothetical protein [Falsiroseomonas sp.]MDP3418548.1 hypothetical protein [Falsiroseomonas sp.]
MRRLAMIGAAALGACGLALPAAAEPPARDRSWFATVYHGQWMKPRGFIGGGFETENSHFTSLALSRVLVPELRLDLPVVGRLLDGASIELEGQFGWHTGLQRHGEATLALALRSREITLVGPWRMNVAVAEGLSYALSRPTYEGLVNNEQPRKFMNYLAFEAEFSHAALPQLTLVPRLHHRSGIFGVIAPQGSGSDFFGLGLRLALQ